MENIRMFLPENFHFLVVKFSMKSFIFLVVKFSVYLNRFHNALLKKC